MFDCCFGLNEFVYGFKGEVVCLDVFFWIVEFNSFFCMGVDRSDIIVFGLVIEGKGKS